MPSLAAAGVSISVLESLPLICSTIRISNSRKVERSQARFRLFKLSHQAIVNTPTPGPSRRMAANCLAGLGAGSSPIREKPKSSSSRRRSRSLCRP